MIIGIVGSRRYTDKEKVNTLVDALSTRHTIVSGGCRGVDTWAIERAKSRGMKTKEILPVLDDCNTRYQVVEAFYSRNKRLVDECDCIFAFVAKDRKGGTENTIKWAEKAGIQVFIYE